MCGRYSFASDKNQLKKQFGNLEYGQNLEINFNVAPTQKGYIIADNAPDALQQFKWGLIPFWAKDEKIGGRMINARSETILEKPAFRQAARHRHCLVIADSFYEWSKKNTTKIPYRILPKDDSLLVMAGIWESWQGPEESVYSFSIITCPPNEDMNGIHDRMPVIFHQDSEWQAWLEEKDPQAITELLQTPVQGLLKMYPVSTRVNSVRNNGPVLHQAVEEQRDLFS